MLRPVAASEYTSVSLPNVTMNIQIALQVRDPNDVPLLLRNARKMLIGLRVRCDGKHFYKREGPEPVFRLPDSINNTRDAADYMLNFHSFDNNDSLATIAYNKDIVAFNSHHVFLDAGVSTQFYDHCLDENFECNSVMSVPPEVAYPEQIQTVIKNMPKELYSNAQTSLLRIKPKDEPDFKGDNLFKFEIPVTKLQCFDKKKDKPVKLTDNLWAACSLAVNTIENRFEQFGINTAFNMRYYLKNQKNINWEYLDHFSIPNIVARKHSMDMTIRELGQEFRDYFNYLKPNCGLLYSWNFPYVVTYPKGVYFNISNAGVINFNDRIKDQYVQSINEGSNMKTFVYMLTLCKVTKEARTFCSRLRWPRESISYKKARLLHESIYHIITEIPLDTSLKEAVAELRNFKKKMDQL